MVLVVNLNDVVVYCGLFDGFVNFWEWKKYLIYGGIIYGYWMVVLCFIFVGSLLLSGGVDNNICFWRRNGDGFYMCFFVLMDYDGFVKCLMVVEEV